MFWSWPKQCAFSIFFLFTPPSVKQNSDSKLCALSHSYSINEIKMVKFLQFFCLFPKPNHDAHGSLKSPKLINVKEMLKMHMNMSQNGAINHERNVVSFILEELIVNGLVLFLKLWCMIHATFNVKNFLRLDQKWIHNMIQSIYIFFILHLFLKYYIDIFFMILIRD